MTEAVLSFFTRRIGWVEIVEFLGFLTAVLGTAMVSMNVGLEFVAFLFYGLSNVCWIAFAVQQRYRWLLMQNAIFMVFTFNGLMNFWPF